MSPAVSTVVDQQFVQKILSFPKTSSDLKINKIRGDFVTLLHG